MAKIKPTQPAKINLHNIGRFIQGWWRFIVYKLTKRSKLLAKVADDLHFLDQNQREQFEWRLTVMNPKCRENGACIVCGCETPQLQMAGEACEGKCYPDMMDKKSWEEYKKENQIVI